MKRPRVTTRMMMSGVLGLALILGLSLPAYQAISNPETHTHTYFRFQPLPGISARPLPVFQMQSTATPFLSRYWYWLSGQKRPDHVNCGGKLGFIEEVCSLGHPEIVPVPFEFPWHYNLTPPQQTEWDRLRNLYY